MAVVKLTYLRDRVQIKRHLRYITYRRGGGEGRLTRQLFNRYSLTDRQSVYELIDAARRGTVFYKFMINLDPIKEDTYKDLDLAHITRQTIQALERQLGLTLSFAAVVHPADHTPLRHIHGIFLLQRRLSKEAFRNLRKTAWLTATTHARLQRRARDRVLEHPRFHAHNRQYTRTQALRTTQPDRMRGREAVIRHVPRGYSRPRFQRGCPSCGFGLTTGISVFLSVCPKCGRVLGRASQSLGLRR